MIFIMRLIVLMIDYVIIYYQCMHQNTATTKIKFAILKIKKLFGVSKSYTRNLEIFTVHNIIF